MIAPSSVWLMVSPVDMRLGIDGLTRWVQHATEAFAQPGCVYLFRNRTGNRMKALLWDGNGVWLLQRRLHRGRFFWPQSGDTSFTLSLAEFEALIQGLDWSRIEAKLPCDWRV
jgi:transposase